MDSTIAASLKHACERLKERVRQALEPSTQPSLPAEIVALLKLPQRNDKNLIKEIFQCFVGTARESHFTTAIHSLIAKYNPKLLPGQANKGVLTSRDLEIIRQECMKVKQAKIQKKQEKQRQEAEEDQLGNLVDDGAEDDTEEQEIYQNYRAAMVSGEPHPDPIVETSSLASIRAPQPTYTHHLQEIERKGLLSDAQLETIVYANMRFKTTVDGGDAAAGFFLGDGAGVGKGRQIAGLIMEHKKTGGKRTLWVSVSNDLRFDARRDLNDLGSQGIAVWPEGSAPIPKGKIDKHFKEGVLFVTYSLLVSAAKSMAQDVTSAETGGVDAQIPSGSRLAQVVDWLKGEEAPLIVLDECHKAKNLVANGGKSTQTGLAILKLQLNIPKAKVLYSSATGASEPNNLAYMIRLGSCGFENMSKLVQELNGSGLGSLEMFSMGLKATGSYVSRALSYQGAEFLIAKIKVEPVFKVMYDRSCEFWHLLSSILNAMTCKHKRTMGQFYGAQQRFYRQMLMAAKVPETAKLALEAVADGMCVVIGLQSTGEANTSHVREQQGDVLEDHISAPQQILLAFLENHFPTVVADPKGGPPKMSDHDINSLHAQVYISIQKWKELLPAAEEVTARDYARRNACPPVANPTSPAAANGAGASSSHRLPAVTDDGDDDDDDVPVAVEALTLDEAILRQREEDKRTGKFITLDDGDDDGELQQARVAIKQEAVAEAEQKKREAAEKIAQEENKATSAVREAEAEVEECRKALAAAEEALRDAENPGQGRSGSPEPRGASGLKRLTKKRPRPESKDRATPSGDRMETNNASEDDEDFVPKAKKRATRSRSRQPSVIALDSDSETEPEARSKPPVTRKPAGQRKPINFSDSESEWAGGRDESMGSESEVEERLNKDEDEQAVTDDENEEVPCVVCGDAQHDLESNPILLCDGCETGGARHLKCLDPPLSSVPEGDWFCPDCVSDRKEAAEVEEERSRACVNCSSENDRANMVSCSTCRKGPWHYDCLDPPLEGVPETFTCKPCQKKGDVAEKKSSAGNAGRANGKITFGGSKVNLGALKMKQKAAATALRKAEERLKEVSQKNARALRATGRAIGRPQRSRASSASSSIVELGSDSEEAEESDTDSDFSIVAGESSAAKSPHFDVKPNVNKDVKPDIKPKKKEQARYKHNVKRDALTDAWEEDVERMPEGGGGDHPTLVKIRNMLVRLVQSFELPANPLDHLTELMGGSDAVAEMTGRKGQLVRDEEDGLVRYQARRAEDGQKMVNMREKYSFMEGEKNIAIISEAASTGISLQADRRVANQRRRCHLTLELPWSADKAIQQFGRSHRSNQTSAPIYRIVVTECAGEFRFAASAAKRLQSLGALLKGDRRALGAGVDLKEFDCDNKWGLIALKRVFDDLMGRSSNMPGVTVPQVPMQYRTDPSVDYNTPNSFYRYMKPRMALVGMMHNMGSRYGGEGSFREDTKVCQKVSTWLNRVLAMTLEDQELLFRYFSDTHDAVILAAKSRGEFDQGITSVKGSSVAIEEQEVIHTDAGSDAKTYHTVLKIDRGLCWEAALASRDAYIEDARANNRPPSAKSGFYTDRKKHGSAGKPWILLATEQKKLHKGAGNRQFRIQRPNIMSSPQMLESDLCAPAPQGYRRVDDRKAQELWKYWHSFSESNCMHGDNCALKRRGESCNFGTRKQPMHLISGAVLPVLRQLYGVAHNSSYGRDSKGKKGNPKVFRAKLDNGETLVGMELHPGDARLFVEKMKNGEFDAEAEMGGGDVHGGYNPYEDM